MASPDQKPPSKPTKQIPAGWYPDPIEPEVKRYWDGEQWVDSQSAAPTHPTPNLEPASEPSHWRPTEPSTPARPTPGQIRVAALAPVHWRLGARLIDLAILLILNAVVNGWFIYQYFSEIMPIVADANRELAGGGLANIEIPERAQRLSMVITAIALLLWLAYELPSLMNNGQTVGKRVLGISVVDLSTGGKPRGGQAFRRWFLFAIPLIFGPACAAPLMGLTAAWCLWDRPARQTLYDKFARTIVVRTDSIIPIAKPESTQGG